MYLQSSLLTNRTPIRAKVDVAAGEGRCRVFAESQERPFSQLPNGALLDTNDIGRLLEAAPRTVYRWIKEYGLTPSVKVGREYLFRKDELLRWYDNDRPVMGRPRSR